MSVNNSNCSKADEYGNNDSQNSKHDANENKNSDKLEGSISKVNDEPDDQLKELGPDYSRDPKTNDIIYTDPLNKMQYVLNSNKTDWVMKSETGDSAENKYDFDGSTYIHTDSSGVLYKWDLDNKIWVIENKGSAEIQMTHKKDDSNDNEEEESEEDDNTTDEDRKRRQYRKRKAAPGWGNQGEYITDPETGAQLYKEFGEFGMTYEWDVGKKAWFPRINEDFMAHYQMNYGFTADGQSQPTRPEEPKEVDNSETKKAKLENEKVPAKKPQWFNEESEKSTKVYVTGLPTSEDYNEEKFALLMGKCGMIEIDIRTNKPKIKLYRESGSTQLKGDGLCTYMKQESVQLATTILDGSNPYPDLQTTGIITVQPAKFEMKGNKYDPKLKPKKLGKKEKEKLEKKKDKMLAWEPDKLRGERNKRDKIIVIKNVFDKNVFDSDPSKILVCSKRLREYCSKFGTVKRVVVYDKHVDGVCQVFFKSPEEADIAISMLDGRMYINSDDRRILSAATWDGKTKYKVNETEEEEKERLANWDAFLQDNAENT